MEDGQRWQIDLNTVCTCTSGKVTCQANIKGKMFVCLSSLSVSVFTFSVVFTLCFFLCHTHKKTQNNKYL